MTVTAPAQPLWRTWFMAVTGGEFLGFLVPACAGALPVDSPAQAPALVGAGAVEGALLGTAQALVLRHRPERVLRRRPSAVASGQPVVVIALIGAAGGLAMAATVAAVTGIAVTGIAVIRIAGERIGHVEKGGPG